MSPTTPPRIFTLALMLALAGIGPIGCGAGQTVDSDGVTQPDPSRPSWATDGRVPPIAEERTRFQPTPGAHRPLAPPAPGIDDLQWMTGCWTSYDLATQLWIEECWTTIVGDMMLGTNRTVRGQRVAAFENLRIEAHADGIWYLASPGGDPAVPYMRVTPTSLDRRGAPYVAVFENLQHDFPQRITYRGDGIGYLEATIEGEMGEETLPDGSTKPRRVSQSWRWTR